MTMHSSNFIESTAIDLFLQASELGLSANSLSISECDYLLKEMYGLSGRTRGAVSFKSAMLYNQLQK
jgi:hypothetical protein